MLVTALPITVPPLGPSRHQGCLWSRMSFNRQRLVMHVHMRSDDLITFGAEKDVSLVSAILSVKYSRAVLYCYPHADDRRRGKAVPDGRRG